MRVPPRSSAGSRYERYSAGEIEAMLELFHPEVEVFVAPPNFESGTYRGHDEYRSCSRAGDRLGRDAHGAERTVREGNWVLAIVEYIGLGKGSSIEVTQRS